MFLSEIRKDLSLKFYIVGVIGLFCLLLINEALYDSEADVVYMVFELLYGEGKELARHNYSAASILIWSGDCSTWVVFFAPLLVSLGFIMNTVSEKTTGNIRMVIHRIGVKRYCYGKILGGIVSAGIIMVSAYMLFGIFAFFCLNSISAYALDSETLKFVLPTPIWKVVVGNLMGAFLYGIYMGAFGMLVVLFFNDKYLVTCFPVMLSFGINRILISLMTSTTDFNYVINVGKYLPDKLKHLYENGFPIEIFMVTLGAYVFILLMYLLVCERRKRLDDWN